MKSKTIVFIILSFWGLTVFAQAKMNSQARVFINELRRTYEKPELLSSLVLDYDLISINQKYHIGLLAVVDDNLLKREYLVQLGVINDTKIGDIWTIRIPIDNFIAFTHLEGIKYIEVGEPVSPYLDAAIPSARVDSVQQGLGGLLQPYTGKGVIIAIIDWGFDYTHPNFYDAEFETLRISRAWDQNKMSGPSPENYSFGTEYIGKDELLLAGSDTLYVFGYTSHGTHVGGIAAGTGAGTPFGGVAYDSEIIFISLRRDAPSLVDAFSYLIDYSESVNKPFVVNMSFGSHLGPHDGTCLKNQAIDAMHGVGKVFVGSAGNNGPTQPKFHIDKDFNENPADTLITVVEFANVTDMFGQTLSMWGSENSSFEVSLKLVDASLNEIYQTPFYNSIDEHIRVDTITFGEDSLIIRIEATASSFINNKPNIRMEVKKTGSDRLVLIATSNDTHLHIWNNVRMNNRYTNWGTNFTASYSGAVAGDNHFGLGEPAGVGKNVITVGSYIAEKIVGENVLLGQISGFSSMGPTVDYRTKPDITSVGANVCSSVNSFDITETVFIASVEFNERQYGFRRYSGTSMSGPIVTGIVALMLEANPHLSAVEVKEILKTTARLDNQTGEIGEDGHMQWGWGKANALAAVLAAKAMNEIPGIKIVEKIFNAYPNPVNHNLILSLHNSIEKITRIDIFCINGVLIQSFRNINSENFSINFENIPNGTYIIKLVTETEMSFDKVIVRK